MEHNIAPCSFGHVADGARGVKRVISKSAIIDAVQRLDLETTSKLLVAKPALLSVTDQRGWNLLHLACAAPAKKLGAPPQRQVRLVEFLLDQGLEIDTKVGRDACTPLFFAVARARNLAWSSVSSNGERSRPTRQAEDSLPPGGGRTFPFSRCCSPRALRSIPFV